MDVARPHSVKDEHYSSFTFVSLCYNPPKDRRYFTLAGVLYTSSARMNKLSHPIIIDVAY